MDLTSWEQRPVFRAAVRRLQALLIDPSLQGRKAPVGPGGTIFGAQGPSGSAVTNTRVQERTDPDAFIREAIAKGFPLPHEQGRRPMEPDLMAAIRKAVDLGDSLRPWLVRRVSALEAISTSLLPLSDEMRAALPEEASRDNPMLGRFHIAFIKALQLALQWPDTTIAEQLLGGMPACGDIPATGVFRPVQPPEPLAAFNTRKAHIEASNKEWMEEVCATLGRRAARAQAGSQTAMDIEAIFLNAKTERSLGLLGDPLSVDDVYKKFTSDDGRLLARPILAFMIWKGQKGRRCEDARRSLTNAITRLSETVVNPSVEIFADMALQAAIHAGGPVQIAVGTDDAKNAYRRVPCSEGHYTLVALWHPTRREPMFYPVWGFNFGLTSAVTQFCRVPVLLCAVARRLLALWIVNYIDDFLQAALARAGRAPQDAFHALVRMAGGLPLDPIKRQWLSPAVVALGVYCDVSRAVSHQTVVYSPVRAKADALAAALAEARAKGALSPALAGKLFGKARSLLLAVAGRVGRAACLALSERQHAQERAWTQRLERAYRFLAAILAEGSTPPRVVSVSIATPAPPIIIFSDASLRRRCIGLVVIDCAAPLGAPGAMTHATAEVPAWFLRVIGQQRQEEDIAHFEELARLAAHLTCAVQLRTRRAVHFVDNVISVAAGIRGTCTNPVVAWLAHMDAILMARIGAEVWYEYVPSACNWADAPSRSGSRQRDVLEGWERLRRNGSREVTFVLPTEQQWTDPLLFLHA